MRVFATILLTLLLAMTSVTFASARVQEIGTTTLVICAQGSAQLVTLDAAGNPVQAPHHCPDCLASFPPPLPPVALGVYHAAPRAVPLLPGQGQAAPAQAASAPLARGPPCLV